MNRIFLRFREPSMCIPFNRPSVLNLLVLSIAVTAIQLLSSGLVFVTIAPNTMSYPIGLAQTQQIGDFGHLIGIGNFVHQTPPAELIVLQILCLAPGVAALAKVRWLFWFPVHVTPGIISNGVEGLLFGQIRNWFVVSFGNDARFALSVGDLWVYVVTALWLIHVGRAAFNELSARR